MINMDVLLGIICTEAIEADQEYQKEFGSSGKDLPPIRCDLELLKDENGSLYWVE